MLGDDLPAARGLTAAGTFTEAKHPRHRKGSPRGGEFAPKVHVANLTPEQRQANLDALKAAKSVKVEGVTRLTIPGGVTTQEIPRQWLVDNGYAVPSSRGRMYGGDGVIQLKRDVDQEMILAHYLSGKKPVNYPVGSKGFDQFMYGRQLPAGASKAEKERMRSLRGKTKADREAIVRRITAALVAAGIDEMEAHALVAAAFDESKHRRHGKGSERGGQFAPKGGSVASESRLDAARRDPDTQGARGKDYVPTPAQVEAQVDNEVEASKKRLAEMTEDYGAHRGKTTAEQFLAEAQRYAYLRWPEAFEG